MFTLQLLMTLRFWSRLGGGGAREEGGGSATNGKIAGPKSPPSRQGKTFYIHTPDKVLLPLSISWIELPDEELGKR